MAIRLDTWNLVTVLSGASLFLSPHDIFIRVCFNLSASSLLSRWLRHVHSEHESIKSAIMDCFEKESSQESSREKDLISDFRNVKWIGVEEEFGR